MKQTIKHIAIKIAGIIYILFLMAAMSLQDINF